MSSKVMASFSAFGGDLPSIAFIVLHSLEGSVLWSSVSSNCLHVFLFQNDGTQDLFTILAV